VTQKTSKAKPTLPTLSKSLKVKAGPTAVEKLLKQNVCKVGIHENKPRPAARGRSQNRTLQAKDACTHTILCSEISCNEGIHNMPCVLTLWRPAAFRDFRKKKHRNARGFAWNFSSPVRATDLVKCSRDTASLVACTWKKIIWLAVQIFCEWCHKSVVLKRFGSWATFVFQKPFAVHKN